ncbi:MAG: MFS transporter [Dehalococcoidales bacterium]|nr:MFS transporter [Dehalococcoidales bacterium]
MEQKISELKTEERDTLPQEERRYTPLALVALTHAFTHMQASLMPLIYPFAVQEFGISYAVIGLLEGVSRFSGGLLQGPAGLLGRFIPRRILLGLNNLLLALSLGFLSLSANFSHFFAATVMGRIVQSPQHPIGNSLISEWFGKKLRGFVFAINYSGANVGSTIVPIIAGGLFAWVGWRGTAGIFVIPGVISGLLAIFMLRHAGKVVVNTTEGSKPHLGGEILKVFKDRNSRFVILTDILATGARGLAVLSVYVPLYLRDTMREGLGLGAMATSILYTVLLSGSVVGPLFLGRISDKFGRIRILRGILLASSLSIFSIVLAGNNLFLVVPVLLVTGFATYSFSPLIQATLADVADPSIRDLTFSVYFPASFAMGAIWTFVLGIVADQFGFQTVFIVSSIAPLAALPFTLPIKE